MNWAVLSPPKNHIFTLISKHKRKLNHTLNARTNPTCFNLETKNEPDGNSVKVAQLFCKLRTWQHWWYLRRLSVEEQKSLRVYSHLSCLVRVLSWSQVRFPPLVWIFWAGVDTAIALGCRPNNRTETQLLRWSWSGSKQTLVRLNGWTNEWMALSVCGFLYSFWFTCKKSSVKANHTKQKKNQNCISSRTNQVT